MRALEIRSSERGLDVASATISTDVEVPVANDGTWFGPHLLRSGQFTVGAKGKEQKVRTFDEAVKLLREMEVAKWRRPNPKGYWGIVRARRWERLTALGDSKK